jgi:hypothetical protein
MGTVNSHCFSKKSLASALVNISWRVDRENGNEESNGRGIS